MWCKVIKSKYGIQNNNWDVGFGRRTTFRCPWKFISMVSNEFLPRVKLKVGNGDRIRFWEDVWCGDFSFKEAFPSLYRVSTLHNAPLSSFISHHRSSLGVGHSWNFHLRRDLNVREIDELIGLLSRLESARLCQAITDRRVWGFESSGLFTCKSFFNSLIDSSTFSLFSPFSFIWRVNIPSKIKVFGWLLALGKVTTFDVLQKRQPFRSLSPNWCVLCKKNLKSIDHVFLHCSFSLHIWSRLLSELGQVWVVPKKCVDIFKLEYFMHGNKRGQMIWNVAVLVIV